MNRRTFLKIAGTGSVAFAAGCTADPERILYSLVSAPDDMVTGQPAWYATACRECPAGCGVLAKNREGRVIKLEGNPHHPVNRGALCMRGQAALQGIYNPDRLQQPMLREKGQWRPISHVQASAMLKVRTADAAKNGRNRVRMISEMTGRSFRDLLSVCLEKWNADGPVCYEPFSHDALKKAHQTLFGRPVLPTYHMDRSDFLLCFGADFLETWLSPVEYARKFKEMHAIKKGPKGIYVNVSPFQSLTAVNADRWVACRPLSEAAVALGLMQTALAAGRGKQLPADLLAALNQVSGDYTPAKVAEISGIQEPVFKQIARRMLISRFPLVLGVGPANGGRNAYPADLASLLLNLVLDPELKRHDLSSRHSVEAVHTRREVLNFFSAMENGPAEVLLINNTNPVFTLPAGSRVREALSRKDLFVVCFSSFMDETAAASDLIFPTQLPLETWDAYGGKTDVVTTLQPAMGNLTRAPGLGDVLINAAYLDDKPPGGYKGYLAGTLLPMSDPSMESAWLTLVQQGFMKQRPPDDMSSVTILKPEETAAEKVTKAFSGLSFKMPDGVALAAVPSIRFFDGRGANRPWLCEIPDSVTQVAWQTPVLMHPERLREYGVRQGDVVTLRTGGGEIAAPVYDYPGLHPSLMVMALGQGHGAYGRFAEKSGLDPLGLMPSEADPVSGGALYLATEMTVSPAGRQMKLARTDGSRDPHGRKIALSVDAAALAHAPAHHKEGLAMDDFPLTLPVPEGYDAKRDIYPPHDHDGYRWGMVVDMDRCIGCSACAAACYAENNLGIVGEAQIVNGREMAWLQVQRYHDPEHPERITFLPMMCQHCDNAPCEPVCPVYAPHHSREGLNNQIYNRCIGTRFCAQNCPYKVRRFNWFEWQWPEPMNLQLNPNVTVRTKGVMEKCSFCIQRIKAAHDTAKNENRPIRDGEVIPACVQTCPTGALTFGSYMDANSRLMQLVKDPRAYQVMGYINTKPAVIYLKKVTQHV